MGTRHHCQRPLPSVITIQVLQGWVGYALRMGLSRAALSNGKCPLFYAFVSKAACFSKFPSLRF